MPVNEPPPHTAFEEAAAAVAGVDAIVFPAAGVSTHFADQSWAQSFARGWTLGCESNTQERSVKCHSFSLVLFHTCVCHLYCQLSLHVAQQSDQAHKSILQQPFRSGNLIYGDDYEIKTKNGWRQINN